MTVSNGRFLRACRGDFHRVAGTKVYPGTVPLTDIIEFKKTYFVYRKNAVYNGRLKWTSAVFHLHCTTASRAAFPYRFDITNHVRASTDTFLVIMWEYMIEAKLGPICIFYPTDEQVLLGFQSEENAIVGQILADRWMDDLRTFQQA